MMRLPWGGGGHQDEVITRGGITMGVRSIVMRSSRGGG